MTREEIDDATIAFVESEYKSEIKYDDRTQLWYWDNADMPPTRNYGPSYDDTVLDFAENIDVTREEITPYLKKANMIEVDRVMSVYSGRYGKCCCGCAGKHTYASKYREEGNAQCGYMLPDDQVNDRTVKLIVGKINKLPKAIVSDGLISAVSGTRLYIAYLSRSAV